MKNRKILSALALLCAVSLCSCGGGSSDSESSAAKDTTAAVTSAAISTADTTADEDTTASAEATAEKTTEAETTGSTVEMIQYKTGDRQFRFEVPDNLKLDKTLHEEDCEYCFTADSMSIIGVSSYGDIHYTAKGFMQEMLPDFESKFTDVSLEETTVNGHPAMKMTASKEAEGTTVDTVYYIVQYGNGELFMLIEADKRGERNKLRLLYSHDYFYVPSNVYLVGMMNTADRSLALLDYALRRRFDFFDLAPAFDSDGFRSYQEVVGSPRLDRLVSCVKRLNEDISADESLGDGFCIGHSYLCNLDSDVIEEGALSDVVEYELLPLLREYWFDDPDKLAAWADELRGAANDPRPQRLPHARLRLPRPRRARLGRLRCRGVRERRRPQRRNPLPRRGHAGQARAWSGVR